MFGIVLVAAVSSLHVYVLWRVASVPVVRRVASPCALGGAGIALWAIFVLGRVYGHGGTGVAAVALELAGLGWMAVLFLVAVPLATVDLITCFGRVLPRRAPVLRGWALVLGVVLAAVGLAQGLRPPVVKDYVVALPGLPDGAQGTTLVALSDLHVGSVLDARWLDARVTQVQRLRPDLVVLLGDTFEGHGPPADSALAALGRLRAPLGVWAVAGNHEFHGNGESLARLEATGVRVLRNRWVEVRSGLILAGTEPALHGGSETGIQTIAAAVVDRPPGALVLLAHKPAWAEEAARVGAGLMLSGHTHGGQIWPFGYLVRLRYPLLAGEYRVENMTVLVCRGTGTWGPRMRLWAPGEILRITLRRG